MAKLIGEIDSNGAILKTKELPIKRLYVPGVQLVDNCPKCGKEHTKDFKNYCIDYPTANDFNSIYMACSDCNQEWEAKVFIEFGIKIVE